MTKPTEPDFQEIIKYLNLKAVKRYSVTEPHRRLMRARFKEGTDAGRTIAEIVEDFKAAIDNQIRQWANDPDMAYCIRPQTLFNSKFDSYVNNTVNIGLAPGEMKEKVVERKPDPMADNKEFNDAVKVSMECFGKEDPESRQRCKRALATMDRLNEQVKNDEIIDEMENQFKGEG